MAIGTPFAVLNAKEFFHHGGTESTELTFFQWPRDTGH